MKGGKWVMKTITFWAKIQWRFQIFWDVGTSRLCVYACAMFLRYDWNPSSFFFFFLLRHVVDLNTSTLDKSNSYPILFETAFTFSVFTTEKDLWSDCYYGTWSQINHSILIRPQRKALIPVIKTRTANFWLGWVGAGLSFQDLCTQIWC